MILEKICSRNGRNRWKKSVGKYNKKTKYVGKKKAKISITKRRLLERRNKIDKSRSRLIKKKRAIESIKCDMTKDEIITDTTEITKNHKSQQQATISQ